MFQKSDLYYDVGDKSYSAAPIRALYGGNFKDLTRYDNLTNADVCEALLDAGLKGSGLIIPDYLITDGNPHDAGKYFWDRGDNFRVRGKDMPGNYALRFMRFAPHADLTRRRTTLREIKEGRYTPRKLFREVLGNEETRQELLNGSYRGIGWWDPKTKKHRILPFEVPVEGEEFARLFGDEMKFEHQRSDAVMTVPSISRYLNRLYQVKLRVLPVTSDGDAFLHEWLMTEATDGCEDRFYRETAGKVSEGGSMKDIYRYASPEDAYCRHGWGALLKAEERSHGTAPNVVPFKVVYPRVREPLNYAWKALNNGTIVKGVRGGERRPIKTDARIQLGRVIGYLGAEQSFYLDEPETHGGFL